jgi:hypothetical protein
VQRRVEQRGIKAARPDERRHFLERSRARQLARVVAAVVQAAIGDQRDRGLEDRHAEPQRMLRGLGRVAPLLGADTEALDVFTRIATLARLSGNGLGAHESTAHVRVERRPADAEEAGGCGGVEPFGAGHALIIRSMLTLFAIEPSFGG